MKNYYLLIFLFLFSFNSYAKLSFRWTGVSSIYLTDGKTSLFFDPTFSSPNIFQIVLGLDYKIDEPKIHNELKKMNISKLDAIFIEHSHFDHALDMHVVQKKVGGTIYGSQTTGFLAQARGVPKDKIKLIKYGETVRHGDFKIKAIKSKHGKILGFFKFMADEVTAPLKGPLDLGDYQEGGSYTYIISHPEGNIVFQQASRSTPEIQAEIKNKEIKALFLGIANRESSKDLYETIISYPKSVQKVIPIHHDNFFRQKGIPDMHLLWGVQLDEFVDYSKKKKQALILPEYFKLYSL